MRIPGAEGGMQYRIRRLSRISAITKGSPAGSGAQRGRGPAAAQRPGGSAGRGLRAAPPRLARENRRLHKRHQRQDRSGPVWVHAQGTPPTGACGLVDGRSAAGPPPQTPRRVRARARRPRFRPSRSASSKSPPGLAPELEVLKPVNARVDLHEAFLSLPYMRSQLVPPELIVVLVL